MAIPVKAVAKSPPKSATRSKAKAAAPAPADPAFLRFYHSADLQARTDVVLAALEASPEPAEHGDVLADLVAELTAAGMSYYYLLALKEAQVGFVTEQSARLAMSGAVKLISSVSRKFIVRMDNAQLLAVARHIRGLAR
jgi:hypothetical protein